MTAGMNDEQIEQMSKTMFRFCLSRTGEYHDAEDLVQEILLIACRSDHHFEDEKAFYAFVWRTAGNILKSWYRRQAGQRIEEPDENLPDHRYEELEEKAQDHEQLARIIRGITRLSSDYRRVMVAYYIDGKSVREIAGDLSLSESMVKYLLFQSRKRIREGINMEMEPGKLSYDPVDLTLIFWGGKCRYYEIFRDNRLRQNIAMACYYDRLTEEQLGLQLGVPTAYLEENLKKLQEYDLLTKKGLAYQSNIVIITRKELEAIGRYNEADLKKIAGGIRDFVDENLDKVRALGFYGSDMPANSIKWMLVSLILRLAYVDMLHGEVKLDFPKDCFGDSCFRFLMELDKDNPYFMGISCCMVDGNALYFWDVPVNGEMLHPYATTSRANMLMSLTDAQPVSDNDKLICSELVEIGLARNTDRGILPNFPCMDAAQSSALNDMIRPVAWEICGNAKSRIGGIAGIMAEYAPEHLADYAGKLPVLFQLHEAETVMRILCESGWLLPAKEGMSATTLIMKNK